MKRYRKATVVWEDSRLLGSEWQSVKSALRQRKTTRAVSIGFVLADDEEGVVLAANRIAGDVAGVTIIPRRAIVDMREVKEAFDNGANAERARVRAAVEALPVVPTLVFGEPPASRIAVDRSAVLAAIDGADPSRKTLFASGHPFTCGYCDWGRDGAYHDHTEYQSHMAIAHPEYKS
jgi:hypothetical protein